jgi:hypothetical protein
MVLIVTFAFQGPSLGYDRLYAELKAHGIWWHYHALDLALGN